MSSTGRDGNLIPDDVQQNYARVRLERGWSWDEMAEQFERDRDATLAAWARNQAAGVDDTGPRYVDEVTGTPSGRRRRAASGRAAAAGGGGAAVPSGRRREGRRRVVPPPAETAGAAAGGVADAPAAPAVPVTTGTAAAEV